MASFGNLILLAFVLGAVSVLIEASTFNDPEWPTQWYLKLMNIQNAWRQGYTGRNVLIATVDSGGLDWTNKEFRGKYNAAASFDFIDNDTDPRPGRARNPHGTNVAGLASAKANNRFCGVGVAYDSKVAGIRFQYNLRGASLEKLANFRPAMNGVDIYTCAWGPGPMDTGIVTNLPRKEAQAIKRLATQGRNSKGSLIVFAAGNGGRFLNHCGYDGYVNSIYTMGITMVNWDYTVSAVSVECTAIMATAFARYSSSTSMNPMAVPDANGGCSKKFSSSSAASAIASGIFALVLQARPDLTWRQVQHLVAVGSNPCPLDNSIQWKRNGANLLVSDRFGFGLLDATEMIRHAKVMSQLPRQIICEKSVVLRQSQIPGTFMVDMNSWPSECGGESNRINYLEHVVLTLNLEFFARGNLEVYLTSPLNTRSIIVRRRLPDMRASKLENYPALSLHHWRENPKGQWKIEFTNTDQRTPRTGTLFSGKLTFYGTATDPWVGLSKRVCQTVNGGYSAWRSYDQCTKSCGGGTQKRTRSCTEPPPSFGGKDCTGLGPAEESRACNTESCPTIPPPASCRDNYSEQNCIRWKDEGDCDPLSQYYQDMKDNCKKTCGFCQSCEDKKSYCPSSSKTRGFCNYDFAKKNCKKSCGLCQTTTSPPPVHGGYTQWTSFGQCSTNCGSGIRQRTRSCTNPPPSSGGNNCVGPAQDSIYCNLRSCSPATQPPRPATQPPRPASCEDNPQTFCQQVKNGGLCAMDFAKKQCKKTCGYCV